MTTIIMTAILCMLGIIGTFDPKRDVAFTPPTSFFPGEKLTFSLMWSNFPAGEAKLEVLPIETVNGEQALHFVMTARTNSFADAFYKVRNRIDAYTDVRMTRSLLYRSKQREGGYRRDSLIEFDWQKQEARYSKSGKPKQPISISLGTLDPLSALYYVRLNELREGAVISRPVTDGSKHVTGTLRVIKKETITVAAGTFETYKVQPETRDIGGVFKQSKHSKLYVWLTADDRKMPVKVKSKVAVGSFVGELVSVEGILSTNK